MRKLKIIEHISLDGVIQVSGEDGDFPYGDWTAPYRTPAGRDAMIAAHGESFDLLLGRRTYDSWSGFWPKAPSIAPPAVDGTLSWCCSPPSGTSRWRSMLHAALGSTHHRWSGFSSVSACFW